MSPRRALLSVVAAVVVLLAGCTTPAPARDDVVQRLIIEYEGATGWTVQDDDSAVLELLGNLADGMVEGDCGAPEIWAVLDDAPDRNLLYAWAVTCETYFPDDMSEAQRDRASDIIVEQVTRD